MALVEKPAATRRRMTRADSFSSLGLAMRLRSRYCRARVSFIGAGVARVYRFIHNARRYALLLELLAHAALSQLLVFLAQAGVGFGEGCIVKVFLFFEARDHCGDDGFAGVAGLDALVHQAAQLRFGAHAAAQRVYGVGVEAGFVEEGAGLGGFSLVRQLLTPKCSL